MIIKIACRAIIIKNWKIMWVKHSPKSDFYALPGWKLEKFETIENCIKREIKEELAVDIVLWENIYTNEVIDKKSDMHILEFFYEAKNPDDFLDIDLKNASHSFEIHDIKWIDIENPEISLLPAWLFDKLKNKTEDYKLRNIIKIYK